MTISHCAIIGEINYKLMNLIKELKWQHWLETKRYHSKTNQNWLIGKFKIRFLKKIVYCAYELLQREL